MLLSYASITTVDNVILYKCVMNNIDEQTLFNNIIY